MLFLSRAFHFQKAEVAMVVAWGTVHILNPVVEYSYNIAVAVKNWPIDTLAFSIVILNDIVR